MTGVGMGIDCEGEAPTSIVDFISQAIDEIQVYVNGQGLVAARVMY